MKHLPILRSIMLATALSVYSCAGLAEDVDLFASAAPSGAAGRPNILIVIDNSANWSRNDQAWPGGKQGQAELNALRRLMDDPGIANVNIGLMMFTEGSGSNFNGGYVRYHVRPMNNPANVAAMKELIGTSACTNGPNSLNRTPN